MLPDITLPIALASRPWAADGLLSLPVELLLMVFSYVSTSYRTQLCLVNKWIRGIAQPLAYHNIVIDTPCTGSYKSRITCLLRALLQREDLAKCTTCLVLTTVYEVKVHEPTGHRTWEPNLKILVLDLVTNPQIGIGYHGRYAGPSPLFQLFGAMFRNLASCALFFDKTAGLQNVERVSIRSNIIERQRYQLPNVKSIHGERLLQTYLNYDPWNCQLPELFLELPTEMLDLSHPLLWVFRHYFTHFNSLRALHVRLSNLYREPGRPTWFLNSRNFSTFNDFLGHLYPVVTTLQDLHVLLHEPWLLTWRMPSGTFTHFIRLTGLQVPQEVLMGASYVKHPCAVLPRSPSELVISYASRSVFPWLALIPPQQAHLKELSKIDICTDETRGDGYEEVFYTPSEVWALFIGTGIHLKVRTDHKTMVLRPEWQDPNYDPFMLEIVGFLKDLLGGDVHDGLRALKIKDSK